MQCDDVSEYLSDQVAGTFGGSRRAEVSQHLADCDRCRQEFDDLQTLWSGMSGVPVPALDSAAMRRRFDAALSALPGGRSSFPVTPDRWDAQMGLRTPFTRSIARRLGVIGLAIGAAAALAALLVPCGVMLACTPDALPPSNNRVELLAQSYAGHAHVRGAEDAAVTLVEYGDFECPPCGFYEPIVARLLREFDGKLKLEFRHFPLTSIHPNAMPAARAAEAAGQQDQFWEMHDLLFETRQVWSNSHDPREHFMELASRLSLDQARFEDAMASTETQERVERDLRLGTRLQVAGTPTFYIGGRKVESIPSNYEGFADLIRGALKQ